MSLATPRYATPPQNAQSNSPEAMMMTDGDGGSGICCPTCPNCSSDIRLDEYSGSMSFSGSFSSDPVRYSNGEVKFIGSDLTSAGFGVPWGHTRSYSNQLTNQVGGTNGNGWRVAEWPYVVETAPGAVTVCVVVGTVYDAVWFDLVGQSYVPRFAVPSTLVHDIANQQYIYTDAKGYTTKLFDYSSGIRAALQGQFKSFADLSGVETFPRYDPVTNLITSFVRQVQNASSGFYYVYYTSGDNVGQLQYVTLVVNGAEVRRVYYTYYGANESFGNLNDLKLATIQQQTQCSWANVQLTYYRYYKPGVAGGFPYGLRYQLGQQSYTQMKQMGVNPETATNAEVAAYADNAFQYDPVTQAAIQEKTGGGNRKFKFSYTNSSFPQDFNNWAVKTVETTPDGNQNIVYTNYAGQVMLTIRQAGQQQWFNCNQYDSNGRVISVAHSSAVQGYDETQPGLVTLNPSSGLIDSYVYYPTTNIVAGAVAGYMQYKQVQQGASGTPILVHQYQYTAQTALGATIYPLWKDICYPNASDSTIQILCTIYGYTWQGATLQIAQKTTTLPVVPTAQNGSGVADRRIDAFDAYGNLTWAMDERGFITNRSFDLATGAVTELVHDVDTQAVSGAPTGWRTPAGGGLNLTTDYTVDGLGRVTQELGPVNTVDLNGVNTFLRSAKWVVYKDAIFQVWRGKGYAILNPSGYAFFLINPVALSFQDLSERETDNIQAVRANTDGPLSVNDIFPQSTWVSWTNRAYAWNRDLAYERIYFDIPAQGVGLQGSNYNQGNNIYDKMQRRVRAQSAGGTILRSVYNPMGWLAGTWIGTNDNGATHSDPTGGGAVGNNMVPVDARIYDYGSSGGNGNLTQQMLYIDNQGSRATNLDYDFRNRMTTMDGEINFCKVTAYDNLDRIIDISQYNTTAAGNLVAKRTISFDSRGRIFQSIRYGVDSNTGQIGPALIDSTWYDPSGNIIQVNKAGSDLLQKTVYDGVNRKIAQYQSCNTIDTGYPYPINVADDTVFQQAETAYDKTGNRILQTIRERFDNATGQGALTNPTGPQPQARVNYVAHWPDALGRVVSTANYGTNQGVAMVRPATAPSSSSTLLVTTTDYNDVGQAYQVTDPQGIVRYSSFDAAGRLTQLLENYVPDGTGTDQNRETDYSYNADGQIATLIAVNRVTGNQVTQYVYGTTLGNSAVASNALLRSIIYPGDSPATPDRVVMAYNRQKQVTSKQDQMGTVHAIAYDLLGRLIGDSVTTLGAGVDDTVLQIARTYEVRGMPQNITSYDSANGGNVVNDVLMQYDQFAQLTGQYQAHRGPASTNSPAVQYAYADGTANTVRATALIYPSSRVLNYDYGTSGGTNDLLSRIGSLIDNDGSTHLADYTYVGLNRVAQVASPQPNTMLSYIQQGPNNPPVGTGGDQYTGWDQFGRVVDQRWLNTTGTDLERCQFGYNLGNNRLWRKNVVAAQGQDEFYTYDGLSQMTDFQRGTLNPGNTGVVGTPAWEEDFTYDPTGNWQNYVNQVNGQTTLEQPRTHNAVNEVLTISGSSSLINQDASGNINKVPQPANWNSAYTMTYDAWNRLVQVMNGNKLVATYAYDGHNWRITKTAGGITRDYYYTSNWQLIEEQVITGVPDCQNIWGLIVGGNNLILRDRPGLGERFYAFSDNFSVRAIADSTGTVQERYGYNSFGLVTYMNVYFDSITDSNYDWTALYNSYYLDRETLFYQVRTRYYNSCLGRFITRDTLPNAEQLQGLNLYAYCVNDPVNCFDPDGQFGWGLVSGICCCIWLGIGVWKEIKSAMPAACVPVSPAKAQFLCVLAWDLDLLDVGAFLSCVTSKFAGYSFWSDSPGTLIDELGECITDYITDSYTDLAQITALICCIGPNFSTLFAAEVAYLYP